ncbi:MAG: type pilus assembly protein PilA [Frankiaceae bacterium]|jgi:type IV pilus assembly protein PilA|nr:type pilus assembly protein PilA [Acidimicrobiaceae bacterium]MDQ1686535.1 type pilus assembly protein PilA [Frankiaceae bacterium]
MSSRWNRCAGDDRGFTLVELITVMVIIGVLAGIAIPLFLNQRSTAFETQLKSDLHNAAIAEESYALHHDGSYLTIGTADDLTAEGFRGTNGVAIALSAPTSGTGFCLTASAAALAGKPDNPQWLTDQGTDGGVPQKARPENC